MKNAPYRDADLPLERRVEDIILRMTVQEKLAQLVGITSARLYKGKKLSDKLMSNHLQAGIGQVVLMGGSKGLSSPGGTSKQIAAIQKFLVEQTRLGIPAILHVEAISGVLTPGVTNFSAGIAAAATWRPDRLQQMTDLIRQQMLALGYRQALSPVMDIARDARWGRVAESYGEDPYQASQMSIAFVRGLQGEDLTDGVAATGKHFLGYGAPEAGLNCAAQHLSSRELYEVHGRPFEAAIQEAGLASIMNSYGEIDSVPVIASKEILTTLLRERMGFEGVVVSDYTSVERLEDPYRIAVDATDAGVQSLEAGLDIELPQAYGFNDGLALKVQNGELDQAILDRAVARVLRLKFQLGLFENPWPREEYAQSLSAKRENNALSRTLATESIVLLKNERKLLPLSPDIGRLAVIGPNADSLRNLFGCYTLPAGIDMLKGMLEARSKGEPDPFIQMGIDPESAANNGRLSLTERAVKSIPTDLIVKRLFPDSVPILKAIRKRVSRKTRVLYEEGCAINGYVRDGIEKAVAVARQSDVAVLVLGGKYGWDADCTSGEGIDASATGLPGVQEELLQAVVETGTPVVLVQLSGGVMGSVYAADHVAAYLESWTPGQEGGKAIADILFGDAVPGGKLPITIPRSAGQIPIYYGHRRGSSYTNNTVMNHDGYIDESFEPLYPFGHGLSYTRFEYSDLELDSDRVDPSGAVELNFRVKNIGEVAGDEVVQVYFSDLHASMVRPNMELVSFHRVHLVPQQSVVLSVTVAMRQLAFLDRDDHLIIEPGTIDIAVGASSSDIRLRESFEIVGNRTVVERWQYSSEVRVSD